MFNRKEEKEEKVKSPYCSGRDGEQLYNGICPACRKIIDHTPIRVPYDEPKPNPAQTGDYFVNFVQICYGCAHELFKPGGEFERELFEGTFDPDIIWTFQEIDGKSVVAIEKNNEDSRKRKYRPGKPPRRDKTS